LGNKACEKNCSISVANREMQIKRLTTPSVGKDVEEMELSCITSVNVK
jgi:hypothetical protein